MFCREVSRKVVHPPQVMNNSMREEIQEDLQKTGKKRKKLQDQMTTRETSLWRE